MARVFISCNHRDFPQGELLQKELIALGHSMTLGVTAKPAGRWEVQLLRGVHDADVFISFLTPHGAASNWVVGQTGMAISCEYTRNQLVLPVCLPNQIPNFTAAFHCFFLNGPGPTAIRTLAAELNEAIITHRAKRPPRIFISHRHKDSLIAARLIDLLQSAFEIKNADIRCTSVPGYRLTVGSPSAETVLADLNGAEIVMGLVTPDTTASDYVLFELGAAWGLRKPTFPLRTSGATFKNVPEVLREKSSLSLTDLDQCLQLIEDVHRVSSLKRRRASRTQPPAPRVLKAAEHLIRAAKPTLEKTPKVQEATVNNARSRFVGKT